ncbi:hypothetical protein [Vibrio sp. 10N.239.312.D08]|uniref:hypothetical protein n=1 Tax=Vibrio sp. 10N.239.312.D08 TaxID=3229978 RepID=UPI00354CC2CB
MRLQNKHVRITVLASILAGASTLAFANDTKSVDTIDHTKKVTIDNKTQIGLALQEMVTDYADNPAPGLITGELYSIQGNLAVGPQAVNFTLNANSNAPVILNGSTTVSPGQTVTFTSVIDDDGRLRIPFKATNNAESKFDYVVRIPQ